MERQRKEQEAVALKHRQMEEENKVAQTTYRRRIEEQRAKERERLEQNKFNREAWSERNGGGDGSETSATTANE